MRSRLEVLNDLVTINGNINFLSNELNEYSWDGDETLLTVTRKQLIQVLEKVTGKQIEIHKIEDWANLIECREDLDFEDELTKKIIFEIANPTLFGEISELQLKEFIRQLSAT